jgi:tRNA threonylcarbamoyladenosine biosynthesis protein TsaE
MIVPAVRLRSKRMSVLGSEGEAFGLISLSPAGTRKIGRRLGRHLRPGDIVCLLGEMGVGKTLLTQGIAEGLGVLGGRGVRSPTFTLVHEYRGRCPIYHLDLYRLTGEDELEGIGWEEYLYGEGVTVIEAADKVSRRLPGERLEIVMSREGRKRRRLTLLGYGERYRPLLKKVLGMR